MNALIKLAELLEQLDAEAGMDPSTLRDLKILASEALVTLEGERGILDALGVTNASNQ